MEDPSSFSSQKCIKPTTRSNGRKAGRGGQPQPFKLHTEKQVLVRKVKEFAAEDAKNRIPIALCQPLTTEKPQNLPKPSVKEQAKPQNFRLHTEERAARRAGFNHLVASKISSLEILRRFEEKIQKVIDEEEVRIMRKEMVPKAQLMPIFDRPFLPQRSTRPLTVPKEPNLGFLNKKGWATQELYSAHQYFSQNLKAIR